MLWRAGAYLMIVAAPNQLPSRRLSQLNECVQPSAISYLLGRTRGMPHSPSPSSFPYRPLLSAPRDYNPSPVGPIPR